MEQLDLTREGILQELRAMAEENYKDFNCKLIPGVDKERTLGVRVPDMRKLAKKIGRQDWTGYLSELDCCKRDPAGVGGTELYYEEVLLQGLVIASAAMDAAERISRIEGFLPRIDNWAVCDTFCSSLKFADKGEGRQLVWDLIEPMTQDSREYYIRFALVMMLGHYVDEEHIEQLLDYAGKVRHEGYYVKMAAAWLLSVCYVKFPQQTEALLVDGLLDDVTHNKTIQKIRESYRISKEDKARLNLLKRTK
ncbi:DNA alkylation repair protein [bacterium 210820-DFI.6.37]|nr:DNA alkylation repair protein [bacterium 210820-DFI.6.37]